MLDAPGRRVRAAAAALVVLASACGLSQPPLPGPFSRDDLAELTDKGDGGEIRAQLLYHYFKKDRDPRLKVPSWIDRELPALQRPIYQDPDDGSLTEAQLWQAPIAVLYEFYAITRKTYPPEYGGFLVKPQTLAAEYRDDDERMKLCVERLRSLHLEGSLGGRGRAAIARLEKISAQIDGLAGSLSSKDAARFKESALAVATETGELYRVFQSPAR
jgi:hypothetical protein